MSPGYAVGPSRRGGPVDAAYADGALDIDCTNCGANTPPYASECVAVQSKIADERPRRRLQPPRGVAKLDRSLTMTDPTPGIPLGLCQCGCGRKTTIPKRNDYTRGTRKGVPTRYVTGHGPHITKRSLPEIEIVESIEADPLPVELRSEDELWLPVVGYEGSYEVSNKGRVRRLAIRVPVSMRHPDGPTKVMPGRLLRAVTTPQGYLRVHLYRDGTSRRKGVHRLVCEAFRGSSENPGMVTRHLNGDPSDNRAENLAWGSAAENMADAIAHGTNFGRKKTHCRNGHPFTPVNTYVDKRGHRECRTCHRINEKARVERKKAAKKAAEG